MRVLQTWLEMRTGNRVFEGASHGESADGLEYQWCY